MNIRYVISRIDKDGLRVMIGPQQGRSTFATTQVADEYLKEVLKNNSEETLINIFGQQAIGTFRMSAIECWPGNNDPKGIYIQKELNPDQDVPEPWRR